MEPVLQNSRRKPRPWTPQDQLTAEVAAACGVSINKIAVLLDRHVTGVRLRLYAAETKANREKVRAWGAFNQEKRKAKNKRWWQANPGKAREYTSRWRINNPEKYKAMRDGCYSRSKNGPARRAATQRWRDAHRERYLHARRECNRRRNALNRAARRSALIPVTRTQIDARFVIWQNRCAFCGVDALHQRNAGYKRLTVEHVLALTKDGLDEASNIMPACHACNVSKSNAPVDTWYRSQPFFTEPRWRKIQQHCPSAVVGQLPLSMAV
jgi:hypothetical protein